MCEKCEAMDFRVKHFLHGNKQRVPNDAKMNMKKARKIDNTLSPNFHGTSKVPIAWIMDIHPAHNVLWSRYV